ncbi:MAG TPA: endonuclease/exonuclease/phosphatase family protein, partial [Actinomycetota bacterium]|nr:endonuclease/exonuclease/phosphatase family protein [Actinomycetota bacterium]
RLALGVERPRTPPGRGPRSFDPQSQAVTVDALLTRIEAVDGPLIVAGDLNISDRHRFYRHLRRHLGDAHRDAGAGFGFTWRAPRPFVRIDYVLRSDHWGTGRSETGTIPGSDHRYVYADLVLL